MKRRIRLTEGDLHRIVKNSVNKVIKENSERMDFDNMDNPSIISSINSLYSEALQRAAQKVAEECRNIAQDTYLTSRQDMQGARFADWLRDYLYEEIEQVIKQVL